MSALVRAAVRALRRLQPKRPAPFEGPRRRRDPSPSRWRYRLDRLGRRGYVRFVVRRLSVPAAVALAGLWLWQSEPVRSLAHDLTASVRESVMDRPEFAVTRLDLEGGSSDLQERVTRRLDLALPVSSLRLDLVDLKSEVESVPGVASAEPRVLANGALRIALTQRSPAAMWRWEGQLHLVDADGVVIAPVARRGDRPDLPLILGEGADRAVPEALALFRRAGPIKSRLRGLVRMGERRWTLALGSDILVHLPEKQADAALSRLLALDVAEDLLDREVSVIDFRDSNRPTLRLTPRAVAELIRVRALLEGKDA